MTAPEKKDYKATLNLPQTSFPMEAKLVATEPPRLAKWREMDLYKKILAARAHSPKWVLHDGPPFANGDIHIGHLINKTLKDVIIRFRTMQGNLTPYVPGWDCHGLPIEHKIQQDLGPKLREMSKLEVRKLCCDYAMKYAGIQSGQFQRLGILGQWDDAYLTLKPAYEAAVLEVFAKLVEAGLVYKRLKPVPWSVANQTALADAELEYKDISSPSVYVELKAVDSPAVNKVFGAPSDLPIYFIIWTTTPWTLPANLAVAVHPDVEYARVKYSRQGQERYGVVADALAEKVFSQAGIASFQRLGKASGRKLAEAGVEYHLPIPGKPGRGRVLLAEYVTTSDGAGLVHTAPGHGEDDFETGIANQLPVYSPVLHHGRYDETVDPRLIGKKVPDEADEIVLQLLKESGVLLGVGQIVHSYPHDWRSKTPIIFRATEQWFVKLDEAFVAPGQAGRSAESLRRRAEEGCRVPIAPPGQLSDDPMDDIEITPAPMIDFVPAWGRQRMLGMLESRPDWCISRQRAWGLPIPVFYNEKGEALLTPQSVRAVAKRFAEKGSDCWFTDSPAELLGGDFVTPEGFDKNTLRKERDIFDVWFESGSSWHAVLQAREDLKFPADLYLEGSDQHRGWFQLSLLLSLGGAGRPPFGQVLTHGFVVKPDGSKVSKSDKDYVTATQEIDRHGADVLRLWCCSVDYQNDIPASSKAIQEFGDKYRKIRNTLRYLLSNLYDFDPQKNSRPIPPNSLDGWASNQLDDLIRETTEAYDKYQLHRVFRLLHDFCAVQISAVYGNAMKDRLYCEAANSPLRRRAQTVMYRMAGALIRLLAPILVFTADEAWEYFQGQAPAPKGLASVHLSLLPQPSGVAIGDQQREEWKLLMDLRDQALAQLDKLKKEVGLNKALDAEVVYQINDDPLRRQLQAYGPDLEDLVGAGYHRLAEKPAGHPSVTISVIDRRATYKACARSWKRRPDVGEDPQYPDLSLRDAAVVRRAGVAPSFPSPGTPGEG